MTTAFSDPVLQRRDRRQRRLARARHTLRVVLVPLAVFAATAVVLCALVGFAEAYGSLDSRFDWPRTWLPRLTDATTPRPVRPLSGALVTLFVGGWLSYLSIRVLRRVMRYGFGPLAIARNVIEEAVRNKIVLVLLGLLVVGWAFWPYSLLSASNPQPLRYQLQSFLSFATLLSGLLLGATTILFSAYTVGGDLQINRTGDVFVKPLSRTFYLVGKWLGVTILVGTILFVQYVVVWGVARVWLGENYKHDVQDLTVVDQRVLTAREAIVPRPSVPFAEAAATRVAEERRNQSELFTRRGAANLFADFLNEERTNFVTINPGGKGTYVFGGLLPAKRQAEAAQAKLKANAERVAARLRDAGAADVKPEDLSLETFAADPVLASYAGVDIGGALLQFRFKVRGGNTYSVNNGAFHLKINGRTVGDGRPIVYPSDTVQVYDVPATLVSDEGTLTLEVVNDVPSPGEAAVTKALSFDPGTFLTLYAPRGGFAANLLRATVMMFVRLLFLAMLGVVTASLMSYPVAAVLSLSLWILAAGGETLRETLASRPANTDVAAVDTAVNSFGLPLIERVSAAFSVYSRVDVGGRLVDGLFIYWSELLWLIFWVGLLWTGVLILVGGYLFGRREVARVQV